jgi:hypothetical protein
MLKQYNTADAAGQEGGATRVRGGIQPPNAATRQVLERFGLPMAAEPAEPATAGVPCRGWDDGCTGCEQCGYWGNSLRDPSARLVLSIKVSQ